MAISELYQGSVTQSTTELSLVSGTSTLQNVTTDGIIQVFLDLSALALGDTFEFRIYEKVQSTGTKRTVYFAAFTNSQGSDGAIWASPALMLMHGWDVTLDKAAGTDRAIPYSIRSVA